MEAYKEIVKKFACSIARIATLFVLITAIRSNWNDTPSIIIACASAITWGVTGYIDALNK